MSIELPVPHLSVAVSSRAIFDLEDENALFEKEGIVAFRELQKAKLDEPAKPGVAFPLIRKLLSLNGLDPAMPDAVRVAIVSKNDPACGRRLVKSCQHYDLPVDRGIFTGGGSRLPYLRLLGANLFLSASSDDARLAVDAGIPAACVGAGPMLKQGDEIIRIAFDGDSVLFSDEAQRVFDQQGLAAFRRHESEKADIPLQPGPMHRFLVALHGLRRHPLIRDRFRISLVTARGMEVAERAMHTMDHWGIQVDEAYFLQGSPKAEWVSQFGADFFFDDTYSNIQSAKDVVPAGHVVYGSANGITES